MKIKKEWWDSSKTLKELAVRMECHPSAILHYARKHGLSYKKKVYSGKLGFPSQLNDETAEQREKRELLGRFRSGDDSVIVRLGELGIKAWREDV